MHVLFYLFIHSFKKHLLSTSNVGILPRDAVMWDLNLFILPALSM